MSFYRFLFHFTIHHKKQETLLVLNQTDKFFGLLPEDEFVDKLNFAFPFDPRKFNNVDLLSFLFV